MAKRTLRILIAVAVTGAALCGAARADQQGHANDKQASPPPATTATAAPRSGVQPAKFSPVAHDVCDKHPNLKQCS